MHILHVKENILCFHGFDEIKEKATLSFQSHYVALYPHDMKYITGRIPIFFIGNERLFVDGAVIEAIKSKYGITGKEFSLTFTKDNGHYICNEKY